MLQKIMSLATVGFISFAGLGVANSQSRPESDAVRIERLKSEVTKLGTGKKVQIKLLSNQVLIGKVGLIEDDKFGLIETSRRAEVPIRYQDVKSIKKWRDDSWHALVFGAAIVGGLMGFVALALRGD